MVLPELCYGFLHHHIKMRNDFIKVNTGGQDQDVTRSLWHRAPIRFVSGLALS